MNNQYKAISILLYLLWPLSAVVIGIKNFDYAFGRKLLIAAFVFFGYTAIEMGDLERYTSNYYQNSDKNFNEILELFIDFQVGKLFNDVTSLLFSPFDNHHLYFGFLFGLYGFFLVNTINMLRLKLLKNVNLTVLISFLAFALFYSVLTIFNYAFFTGGIYFLYFLLKLVLYQKKSSYFFILLTPLFHYGTIPLLLVPLFLVLFKQRTYLYTIVLIICSFVSHTFLVKNLEGYLVDTDTILETKFNSYATEEGKEKMDLRYSESYERGNSNNRLFQDVRSVTNNMAIPLLLLLLFTNLKTIKKDETLLTLFNLSIGCMAITQLMLNISQGERFNFLSGFMTLGTLAYFVQKYTIQVFRFKGLLYVLILFIMFNNILSIVIVKNLVSLDFMFTNFPYLFFKLLIGEKI